MKRQISKPGIRLNAIQLKHNIYYFYYYFIKTLKLKTQLSGQL
jgi:hypothetical protein